MDATTTMATMDEPLLTSENTVPSSPAPAVFSDDTRRESSPPSSPPGFPWEKQDEDSNVTGSPQRPARTAFSVLGKRKALEQLSNNARPNKKPAARSSSKGEGKTLTQMQISLGQEVQKKCRTCGMEYISSSTEDRKLHDKYHRQNTEGYDVGKDFIQKARRNSVFKGAHEGDSICALDFTDTQGWKRRGQGVLEVVQRELGAVEIPQDEIWSSRHNDVLNRGDCKFKAYLYIRRMKCIGFLLTQKIGEMHLVLEPTSPQSKAHKSERSNSTCALTALKTRQQAAIEKQKLPIQLSSETHPAQLGICRIWTSSTHRHQNIAMTLLDIALEHHNACVDRDKEAKIEQQKNAAECGVLKEATAHFDKMLPALEKIETKQSVAFSQPTDAGTRLARRWFGKAWGWGIYVD